MSEKHDNVSDLDLVGTDALIAELVARHDSTLLLLHRKLRPGRAITKLAWSRAPQQKERAVAAHHAPQYDAEPPQHVEPEPFGRLVAELRIARGMTQSDVARAAGRSVSTIASVERGSRVNRPQTSWHIYLALNSNTPLNPLEARRFSAATGLKVPIPDQRAPLDQPRTFEDLERLLTKAIAAYGPEIVGRLLFNLTELGNRETPGM